MSNLGTILFLVGAIGTWYFIKRKKDNKKRNISIVILIVGIATVGIFGKKQTVETSKTTTSTEQTTKVSTESSADKKAQAEYDAKVKAEKEKQDAVKKKLQEEEAKNEADNKNPETYNTGVTFEDLARNPTDNLGKKVTFTGKIAQVIEGDNKTQYRIAVNDDYKTVLYAEIDNKLLSSRLLDDDNITVYGLSLGTISYNSTGSGKITVPAIKVNMFNLNK